MKKKNLLMIFKKMKYLINTPMKHLLLKEKTKRKKKKKN